MVKGWVPVALRRDRFGPSSGEGGDDGAHVTFTDITLDAASGRRSTRTHDSAGLVADAVAVFTRLLARGRDGDGCHVRDTVPPTPVTLRLDGDVPAGIAAASFHSPQTASRTGVDVDAPLTTSVLLAGVDPDREHAELGAFEVALHRIARSYGLGRDVELGYALTLSHERPLLATWVWPVAFTDQENLKLVADMETCLAAAWFQYVPHPHT